MNFTAQAARSLLIVPVRARMVTDEAVYVERHDPDGTARPGACSTSRCPRTARRSPARAHLHAGRAVAQPARKSRVVHRAAAEGRARRRAPATSSRPAIATRSSYLLRRLRRRRSSGRERLAGAHARLRRVTAACERPASRAPSHTIECCCRASAPSDSRRGNTAVCFRYRGAAAR